MVLLSASVPNTDWFAQWSMSYRWREVIQVLLRGS
jgi:superfamily II RNA helicase